MKVETEMVYFVCVCRDDEGNTTHLGMEGGIAGPKITLWSVKQIVEKMEKDNTRFFIRNSRKEVEIVRYPRTGAFEYLATRADNTPINNLDFTKECDGCS